ERSLGARDQRLAPPQIGRSDGPPGGIRTPDLVIRSHSQPALLPWSVDAVGDVAARVVSGDRVRPHPDIEPTVGIPRSDRLTGRPPSEAHAVAERGRHRADMVDTGGVDDIDDHARDRRARLTVQLLPSLTVPVDSLVVDLELTRCQMATPPTPDAAPQVPADRATRGDVKTAVDEARLSVEIGRERAVAPCIDDDESDAKRELGVKSTRAVDLVDSGRVERHRLAARTPSAARARAR